MSMRLKRALALALACLPSANAFAQELRGQIIGSVKDSTGLALPGVTVTAQGSALVIPQTTTSTGDGW